MQALTDKSSHLSTSGQSGVEKFAHVGNCSYLYSPIMANDYFQFKQFTVWQQHCAMKVGTDGTLLGAWAHGGSHILDVGTGTGLIALMMAQRFDQAHIVGIDIDYETIGSTGSMLMVATSGTAVVI